MAFAAVLPWRFVARVLRPARSGLTAPAALLSVTPRRAQHSDPRNALIPWHDSSLDALERVRLYAMQVAHEFDFSEANVRRCLLIRQRQRFRDRQRLTEQQIEALGLDLAVAQMVVRIGGAVQFKGSERWFRAKDRRGLPSLLRTATESESGAYRVESLDLSGTPIMYEGLSYIRGLSDLRHLLLRNCAFIDDFCLARLQPLRRTLLFLDLSCCPLVSARGLSSLWCMHQLRRLVLEHTSVPELAEDKELVCLLLEERQPKLTITGVDFKRALEASQEQEALEERAEAHRKARQLTAGSSASSEEKSN